MMTETINCHICKKNIDFTFKFCPQCGNLLYFDLSKIDKSNKAFNSESFTRIITSVYNLIIFPDNKERDFYFHPISRKLISKRFELEYQAQKMISILSSNESVENYNRALNVRLNTCQFNALTGYSVRVAEELISKGKTTPFSTDGIDNGIKTIEKNYSEEFMIKNVISKISNESDKRRLLFIVFIQDENKHMNYFLEEDILQRTFESILEQNIRFYEEKNHKSLMIENEIVDEVLNDIVFGYCVKLSESLFPIS